MFLNWVSMTTVSCYTITGTYPLSPQLPAVGGNEMAGTVTEIGSKVTSLKPGDHVIAAQPGIGTSCSLCHDDTYYVMMHILCHDDTHRHMEGYTSMS